MTRKASRSSQRRRLLYRMLARRLLVHSGMVLLHCLQLLLAGLALCLVYVLLRDDIPIPDFLYARIERELARAGLQAEFDRAQFDPTGRIHVRGLRLHPARFGEAVVTGESVLIELNRLKLLSGAVELKRVEAEGLRLVCPPSISPSGMAEPLLEIATVRLGHDGGRWTLDGIVARAGPIDLTARGSYSAEERAEKPSLPNIDAMLDRFGELAPRIVRAQAQLKGVGHPAIAIVFGGSGRAISVEAALSAESFEDAKLGEATRIRVKVTTRLELPDLSGPVRIVASVDHIRAEGLGSAAGIEAAAEWANLPSPGQPWPDRVDLAVGRVAHPRLTVAPVAVVLHPRAYPQVRARVVLPLEGEPLEAEISADAVGRSGTVLLRGRLGRAWLARASEIIGRDVTYYATIAEPPDFLAVARVAPGLQWSEVDLRLLSGPVTARGVDLDRARIALALTPRAVRVRRLEVSRGDEYATGSYADVLATRENRLLLRGAMRPLSIAPWFGVWWSRFWDDYGFGGAPPAFDLDMHGNWVAGERNIVTGRMQAEAVTVHGRPVNRIESRFFIRPNYYDLFDASIEREEGRIDGEVQLQFLPQDPNPVRQSWQFTSTADLVELAGIFGPGGDGLFEPYRYETPPRVRGRGLITRWEGRYDSDVTLRIETPAAFRYWDFPLDSLEADVRIRNLRVELPEIRANYGGGVITGNAVADNGRLTFSGKLAGADYDLASDTFRAFLDRRSPPPEGEPGASSLSGRRIGGRMDLALSASGPLTQYDAFEGSGEFSIRDGDFARLNLLGPLGDLLGGLGIRMATLSLRHGESSFEVRRERLVFPDLRITGRTGALECAGTYFVRDGSVDFRARLFPLREPGGFLTQMVGVMLDPFSNLLEMRLTGTLRQPQWSLTGGPIFLMRDPTSARGGVESLTPAGPLFILPADRFTGQLPGAVKPPPQQEAAPAAAPGETPPGGD